MSKVELKLDWCSHEAAKYAVEHWHYTRSLPAGKAVKVGVWELGHYIGSVMFSRGSNRNIGRPFGLLQTEVCELTRVALCRHLTPVSRIVSIAIKMLRRLCTGIRLIVSYADPSRSHRGGIYQAMCWLYIGMSNPQRAINVDGVLMHKRSVSARWGTASPAQITALTGKTVTFGAKESKHTYCLPLDESVRARLLPLAKPYPKKISAASIDGDAAANQVAEGGSIPTAALQIP